MMASMFGARHRRCKARLLAMLTSARARYDSSLGCATSVNSTSAPQIGLPASPKLDLNLDLGWRLDHVGYLNPTLTGKNSLGSSTQLRPANSSKTAWRKAGTLIWPGHAEESSRCAAEFVPSLRGSWRLARLRCWFSPPDLKTPTTLGRRAAPSCRHGHAVVL